MTARASPVPTTAGQASRTDEEGPDPVGPRAEPGRGGPADPDASLAIHHVHVQGGGQPSVRRSQTIDASTLIDLAGYSPKPASGAQLLSARDIKVLDCAGSVCQAQIEWIPTQGLRAPSLSVKF